MSCRKGWLNSMKNERNVNKKLIGTAAVIAVVVIALHFVTGGKLLTPGNLLNVLGSMTVPAIMAIGFAFVFGSNVTDLSPGAIVILAATVAGVCGEADLGIPVMILLSVLTGVACGVLNYSIFRFAKIPPWIAGLGMTMVYEAIAGYYQSVRLANGKTVVTLPSNYTILGTKPYIYIVLVLVIAAAYIIYNHTTAGINIRAAGCNENVASVMGINVTRSLIICGVIAGAFFGFAGCMKECYATFANPQTGLSSLSTTFQPLAAVLLGKALSKEINYMIAVPLGSFLIILIFNILTLVGVPSGTFQEVCLGLVIVLFGILAQRSAKGVVK